MGDAPATKKDIAALQKEVDELRKMLKEEQKSSSAELSKLIDKLSKSWDDTNARHIELRTWFVDEKKWVHAELDNHGSTINANVKASLEQDAYTDNELSKLRKSTDATFDERKKWFLDEKKAVRDELNPKVDEVRRWFEDEKKWTHDELGSLRKWVEGELKKMQKLQQKQSEAGTD